MWSPPGRCRCPPGARRGRCVLVTLDQQTVETTPRHPTGDLRMRWQGALVGHGSHPGGVLEDGAALPAAERFLGSPGLKAA